MTFILRSSFLSDFYLLIPEMKINDNEKIELVVYK